MIYTTDRREFYYHLQDGTNRVKTRNEQQQQEKVKLKSKGRISSKEHATARTRARTRSYREKDMLDEYVMSPCDQVHTIINL
jgi:hypothetical protein